MSTDIGTNPPASAGAAGVQDANPPGYETGAGPSDEDQGLAGQSDGDLPEGEEGALAPELDEIEHEGQKHQIPKAIRPLIDKGLDYTQKTQELADQRRQHEQQFAEQQQQFEHRQQAAQVLHEGRAAVAALDLQLQQYQGINWQAAAAADPAATQQAYLQYQQLRDQRQGVAQNLQAAEQHFSQRVSTEAKQRVAEVVTKWKPEEQAAVNAVAKDYGITPQILTGVFGSNPMLLTILRDAALYQKATKTAAAVTAPKPSAAPQASAVLPRGNGSAVPKSLSDPRMSDEEWNKRRNEQIRRSRRR